MGLCDEPPILPWVTGGTRRGVPQVERALRPAREGSAGACWNSVARHSGNTDSQAKGSQSSGSPPGSRGECWGLCDEPPILPWVTGGRRRGVPRVSASPPESRGDCWVPVCDRVAATRQRDCCEIRPGVRRPQPGRIFGLLGLPGLVAATLGLGTGGRATGRGDLGGRGPGGFARHMRIPEVVCLFTFCTGGYIEVASYGEQNWCDRRGSRQKSLREVAEFA